MNEAVDQTPVPGRKSNMLKRGIDVLAAVFGLAILAPLIVGGIVAVRVNSPGPGLFAQTRVGRFGRPFTCYKIRTMMSGVGDKPSHEASALAITPLGAWMRRSKLDELPQLWNVLLGEMSLVGPRPCLPSQTELIEARRRFGVLNLRPGITGISQVQGIDMSQPQLLARTDASYRGGLAEDLRLVSATIFGGGRGDAIM